MLVGHPRWFAPRTVDELADLWRSHPQARLVAGATDVGLWVTKQQRVLEEVILLGDVAELRRIEETPEGVQLGAGVRYSEAQARWPRLHPALGELVRRIAGAQVRNAGTIGGNIANGSPIGDMPPALIALGAKLTLRAGANAEPCRWRISSWPMANRIARRASSSRASSSPAPRPPRSWSVSQALQALRQRHLRRLRRLRAAGGGGGV